MYYFELKHHSIDRLITSLIVCFLYARSGVFNKGVNLNLLMAAVVPNFNPELKKSTDISKTLDSIIKNNKNKGNTSVASMITMLEAFNLGFQLTKPMSIY